MTASSITIGGNFVFAGTETVSSGAEHIVRVNGHLRVRRRVAGAVDLVLPEFSH